MIFFKSYFWISFGIVALFFVLLKKKVVNFSLLSFLFPSERHFHLMLAGSFVVATFFNLDYQLFCMPVLWTKVALLLSTTLFLASTYLKRFRFLNELNYGLLLFIALYIILFGSVEYLAFSILNIIIILPLFGISQLIKKLSKGQNFGFLNFYAVCVLMPYLLLFFICERFVKSSKSKRIAILCIPSLILIVSISFTLRINSIDNNLRSRNFDKRLIDQYTNNVLDRYLLELQLGAHWKYHTRICLYDGRRPPFHEPVLIICRNLLKINKDYYGLDIKESRIDGLYAYAFPEKTTVFDCQCAKYDRWPGDF